ncbi:haloacid dehalogenase-like hydrolase [Amycolatopsis sp. A133]|uniref:HAD family hydrolase n=1 Tax=Amycolatopsis sp. A133 TaxID=3064472 RepID=UPI0027F2C881|nr:haloacid dehalogenase-like hydrolase [Amycolatopsis sp. A133]MDQ7808691.1 haloacid dehalogenase-like hydrolase [Amycolatopsis sp. A133]
MNAGCDEQFLLLWDIDGTLIEAAEFRRAIYSRLFAEILELPFKKVISAPGFSTLEKIRRTLLFHDVTPTDRLVARFSAGLAREYVESREELVTGGRLLPGATAALRHFAADGRFVQAVLTCTLKAIACAKIEAFGLSPLFDMSVGAYGDDALRRVELPDVARRRCRARTGRHVPRSSTFIIGDTEEDMRAARCTGVHAVGVATGRCAPPALWRAGADVVILDLTDIALLQNYLDHLPWRRPDAPIGVPSPPAVRVPNRPA